jgi:hypothetical protein
VSEGSSKVLSGSSPKGYSTGSSNPDDAMVTN